MDLDVRVRVILSIRDVPVLGALSVTPQDPEYGLKLFLDIVWVRDRVDEVLTSKCLQGSGTICDVVERGSFL